MYIWYAILYIFIDHIVHIVKVWTLCWILQQVKELEARCAQDIKDMQAEQVKASVETSKEVQNDPKLKTKAEKDRRLKEKQAANTKRFMDERKTNGIQHNKAKNKLKNAHTKQTEDLAKWIKSHIAMINEEEAEYKLANKREAFV